MNKQKQQLCNNNNSKNWKDTRHSYCTNGTEAAPLVHMVPLRTQESAQSFTHSAGSIFGSKFFFSDKLAQHIKQINTHI